MAAIPVSAATPATVRLSVADGPTWTATTARQNFAPGVPTVLLVRSSYPEALAIATPLAAKLGAPLLVADGSGGSEDTATFEALDYLKASKALLIGPDWTPKFPIYGQVASRVTTTEPVNGPGRIGLSAAVAQKFAQSSGDAFIASGLNTSDTATAASAAAALRVPLILTETAWNSWSAGSVTELKRLGTKNIYQVGALPAADDEILTKAFVDAKIEQASTLAVTPEERNHDIGSILEVKNVDSSKVYIGSTSYPGDAITAAAYAARDGAFLRLAPNSATVPAKLGATVAAWGPEVEKVVLVGDTSRITAAFETNLRSLIKARAVKSEFGMNSFAKTPAGTMSIGLSTKSGATSYEVFDLGGALVASSALPTFELPALTSTVKVRAKNGSQVIAERDVRISEGNDKAGTTDRVATSAYKGQVTLNWSEAAATATRPRQIFRSEVTRAADGSLQQGASSLIGITCAKEFTDASPTTSLQNLYEVIPVGEPTNNACGTTLAPPTSRTGLALTSLSVPTQLPGATSSASTTLQAESTSAPPRATPTLAEKAFMDRKEATAAAAASSTITTEQAVLPWVFRYRMFLRETLVRPMPWHGQTMYGDRRSFSSWAGTHRTQVDTTFNFDSQWRATGATFAKNVGQSIEYNCPNITNFNNCSETGRRTASSGGISTRYQPRVAGVSNWPYAAIDHSVADPFPVRALSVPGVYDFYAPPIDYSMSYNYFQNGFTITGTHDCAPYHEIWGGYVPGEFIPIMLHPASCSLPVGAAGGWRVSFTIKV